MTIADDMYSIVQRGGSIENIVKLLKDEAPNKHNCFNCGSRKTGLCPIFTTAESAEDIIINMPSAIMIVACYCATGCGMFTGD